MKKIILCICMLFSLVCLTGCEEKYTLYSTNIIGPFDTVTTYMSYSASEEEFNQQTTIINERLEYYDNLFDRYNNYPDLNNVKTINDLAGKESVKVDPVLIDLLTDINQYLIK